MDAVTAGSMDYSLTGGSGLDHGSRETSHKPQQAELRKCALGVF